MDSTLWILDWIPGTGLRIPCRVEFACIPWAELQIPMPRIADSTSKNFPDFESQIALYGAKHGEILSALFPRIPWFSWKQGKIGAGFNSSQACIVLKLVKRDYSRKRIRYNRLYQGLRLSVTQVRGRPVAD